MIQKVKRGDESVSESRDVARTRRDAHQSHADVVLHKSRSGIVIRLPRRFWEEWLNVP